MHNSLIDICRGKEFFKYPPGPLATEVCISTLKIYDQNEMVSDQTAQDLDNGGVLYIYQLIRSQG